MKEKVLKILQEGPLHLDELINKVQARPRDLALLRLELLNLINEEKVNYSPTGILSIK